MPGLSSVKDPKRFRCALAGGGSSSSAAAGGGGGSSGSGGGGGGGSGGAAAVSGRGNAARMAPRAAAGAPRLGDAARRAAPTLLPEKRACATLDAFRARNGFGAALGAADRCLAGACVAREG